VGNEAGALAFANREHPEAVVLDLVQPIGIKKRPRGPASK
jgi:hypothetical protein